MREALNSNPIAQVALVGVLLLATGFFVLSSMGGGEEEGEGAGGGATASVDVVTSAGSAPVTPTTAAPPAPTSPPPKAVTAAYESGQTVALLFVDEDGIDDRIVTDATDSLAALPGVRTFVVPAAKISRYVAITGGVGVERVPALVVVRPKRAEGSVPTASVSYGFQSPQSVVQAVVDAGYKGPTLDYHP